VFFVPDDLSAGGRELAPKLDTSVPHSARIFTYWLGGKDNYPVDRAAGDKFRQTFPDIVNLALIGRQFLKRVIRYLAGEAGIRQFLDIGTGLPTADNTHEVAQRVAPESRVVYVDNDPVVLAHGRALLEENENTCLRPADIFEPSAILNDDVVRSQLDFSEPLALFQLSTLHYHDGKRSPADIMREYIDALPSGSYVAISHFFDPETSQHSELARRLEQTFLHSPMGTGLFRTRAEIEAMLPGLELVPPGLIRCADWWPDGPRIKPLDEVQHCIAGAVGRKP
jgi:SAM-dependent methyltransferase